MSERFPAWVAIVTIRPALYRRSFADISNELYGTRMTDIQRSRIASVALLAVLAVIFPAVSSLAGPVDFGKEELRRALATRGLSRNAIAIELRPGPAETWSVSPRGVVGGDERGLMYGLLEAADQIRRSGKLSRASGQPATPMRGIRYFIHNQDLEER